MKEQPTCECEYMTCKTGCISNHTHKTFFCDKCKERRNIFTPHTENWGERYTKRFLESNTLSDGTKIEYIHLKGTALEQDFLVFIEQEISHATQQAREDTIKEVMPYLKAYLSTLNSDWSINPIQACTSIYISLEQSLRNQADAIENKRRMESKLKELIETLSTEGKEKI